jgi:uncharacterized membrane protein YciS (DUF1049 family)
MLTVVMTTTGYLFWALILLVIFIDAVALGSEDDSMGGWAVFLTVAALILTTAFTDAFIGVNWLWMVVVLFGYLFLGVCWSFKKWIDFIKREKLAKRITMPLASQNKQRITTWMATWPLSFTWWVLTYPRHFFVWAYERLSTVYDRIATKIWDSV